MRTKLPGRVRCAERNYALFERIRVEWAVGSAASVALSTTSFPDPPPMFLGRLFKVIAESPFR
ncbi:MAG: hypothetical protein IPL64_12045 [Flavobacteriales bacterium]|nr:hypothetical protein [Flavobacteriales bacterium]